jgi:hypothetical protein
MNEGSSAVELDPKNPAAWTEQPFGVLLALSKDEVEDAQREALIHRFTSLRPGVAALDKLANRQGVERVESVEDALPVFFDHKVLKSYPLGLIEKRRFDQLTAWLGRLTTQDVNSISLDGVDSVDEWLKRLDDFGMFLVHSTGTTGKLSFVPRSKVEWPAFQSAHFEAREATCGIDLRRTDVPMFATSYRSGHQSMVRVGHVLSQVSAGGEESRHPLYDFAVSSDLLSLAGRLQGAEERGELEKLALDPALLKQREALIERGRHRNDDVQQWFFNLADKYRGHRVYITGTSGDLVRLALAGIEQGITCEFTPDSVLFAGGGMKGLKDPPADWEALVTSFFGVERISGIYGMSECIGIAPKCSEGFYHFFPYTIPIVLDEESRPLPSQGVQTGRMALFDLLAETYWGGFITGDRVSVHWEPDCGCGWKSPRVADDILRYGELEGGDDKISCAGTAQAYNEFMDYVSSI